MNKAKTTTRLLVWPIVVAIALALAPQIASAADSEVSLEKKAKPKYRTNPPFRTNLGVQLALGGNSCIGGGSSYATCYGTDFSWDTGWGLSTGILTRPFDRVSFGLDFTVTNMRFHQETASTWRDITVGPAVRYHHPLKIRKLYFEPNIGLQAGYVRGSFSQAKQLKGTEEVDYVHRHVGAFLAAVFGVDFFLLPKVAIGLEFRVIRTLYTEVCFESSSGTACRGINDKAVVERYDLTQGSLPSEMGIAKYPWKLFYGIHGLYYF